MIQQQDLEKLISGYAQKFKQSFKIENGKPKLKDDVDFHDTYTIAKTYMDRVRIHAEVGGFPDRIFLERAPNQTEKEFKYIKGNYKQNTLPVYTDFHSTISRAWSDGNWSIKYKEDNSLYKDNTLQEYLEKDIRLFGSLENYWKSMITHIRNIDPNGIVAVKPEPQEYVFDENGQMVIDTSTLPKPQPYYYRCDQVIFQDSEIGYLVISGEKSNVEYAGKVSNVGLILEFYDDTAIYIIRQTGKWTDWTFSIETYFVHNWGKIPATKLKAVPQFIGDDLVYVPEFLYACDNLDLALMNAQYLQVSIANSCFPYRVMVGNSCDFEEKEDETGQYNSCNGTGYITRSDQSRHQCPKCGGSGLKDRVSPLGVLLLSKEDWSGNGDKSFADRAMYYVSPDISALEFVKTKVEDDTNNARKILHLHTSNSQVRASEKLTATGMTLDQKAQYAFIKPISDNLFSAFEYVISAIGWMRYGEKFNAPTLVYPNTFDYNTEEDYLTQLSEAQKAGLPPFIIYTIFHKFLQTLYYYEKKTTDVFRLIVASDRILTMSSDESQIKLQKGLVEKWEIVLHDSSINFVNELEDEVQNLFELTLPEQVKLLTDKAKAKADNIVSPSTSLQQNTVNSIIGG